MGLFNGLLGPQNDDSVQNNQPQPPPQNSSSNIVDDPPIKEELPKETPPPHDIAPDHLNVHRDSTPSDTPVDSYTPDKPTPPPPPPTPPSAPLSSYSHTDPFPELTPIGPTHPTPPPPPASSAQTSDSGPVSLNDLQGQLDIINNFKKNPSVEALIALMYHKDDYMEAMKSGKLDELLENIRKYNPLVHAFNEANK